MSGHSKWAQIKRKKGALDARRGQLFTKLSREIAVAARQGGADPAMNFRLRLAVQRARDNNMPLDTIERAIKKGSGEGQQEAFQEVTYEGYGPGGAAIYVEVTTDNRNRAASEVRHVFSKHGGSLGEAGSVAWLFEAKGVVAGEAPPGAAEELALSAIDAGADDVKTEGDSDSFEVVTPPERLEEVRRTLEEQGATISSSELQMVPKSLTPLDVPAAQRTLRLLEALEELDDVQRVYTNADFPDEVFAQAS